MPEPPKEPPTRLPSWGKALALIGIFIVIATGLAVAFVPGWEIRHANSLVGLKLHGTTAIVVGLGIVLWSLILALHVLFPEHWIWTRWRKPPAEELSEVDTPESERET